MSKRAMPTQAEMGILGVLWRLGSATVGRVRDELGHDTGYTTVLKLMQIMTEKGLVKREPAGRSHVYRAAAPEAQTLRGVAGNLLDRAFGGSTTKLLVAALSARPASSEELREMRRLLREAQKERNSP